jgi:allantoinase
MKADLLIINGRLVTPKGIFNAGIAIKKGKIVSIAKTSNLPPSDKKIDAHNNFVIPGVIDGHVHFWDPGYTYREDWQSGTMSAASGGVTTVIDMPTTSPPTITPESFIAKRKIAQKKAVVDFALHAGGTPQTIHHISELIKEGATSFKMFIAEKVRQFENMNKKALHEALKEISKHNALASFHAESELVPFLRKKLQDAGRMDIEAHLESRPIQAESEAIIRILQLAEKTKARLHICHMTSAKGAKLVKEAKEKRIKVSAETCPQYLLFNKKYYLKMGPYLKVNPPIRTKEDQIALWKALQNHTVDIVASDHCPFPCKEKEIGWKNIWKAGTGVPGTETLLPLMISEGVNKDLIDIQSLCKILCENPARIFGLYPKKGIIEIGSDADLVIIDLKQKKKITIDNMYTKAEFTPFEGWEITGSPITTIVRGNIIVDHGNIIARSGYGMFIPNSA